MKSTVNNLDNRLGQCSIDYEPNVYKIDKLYLETLSSSFVLSNIRFFPCFNTLRFEL